MILNIITLSVLLLLCWVSLCWIPLCWVSLCWMPLCWVSWPHSKSLAHIFMVLDSQSAKQEWIFIYLSFWPFLTIYFSFSPFYLIEVSKQRVDAVVVVVAAVAAANDGDESNNLSWSGAYSTERNRGATVSLASVSLPLRFLSLNVGLIFEGKALEWSTVGPYQQMLD